ncbi:MAG: hypothetical protein ACYDAE_23990 [Steroidobacteraceae bacterium]
MANYEQREFRRANGRASTGRRRTAPVHPLASLACIRIPAFLLLVVLEPVVSFVLCSLALLGVLTAFLWKFVWPPHFPFFLVLGVSLGFEFALVLYHAVLRLLGTNW